MGYIEDIFHKGIKVGERWAGETPEPPQVRRVSRLAFRNRFTDAEKLAIYTAAESSAQIRVWLDDLAAAEFIDLDYPATVAGVQALELAGLIGAGRAAEVVG